MNNSTPIHEKKLEERKKRVEKHLKNSKFLHQKFSKQPLLFNPARFFYRNFINILGSFHLLPDFLICGTPRSGSTSLYEGLLEHPNVYRAKTKEVSYFDVNTHRGINWYKYNFPSKLEKFFKKNRMITGEATPFYLIHPHVPARIAKTIPNVKIILILRNPIDRAYSHYSSAVKNNNENLTFEESLQNENSRIANEKEKLLADPNHNSANYYKWSYFEQGIYYNFIIEWMKYFPKENFYITSYEEFFKNPKENFNDLFNFLGISNFNFENYVRYNRIDYSSMKDETRENLKEFYKPYNEKLYKLIGKNFNWN
tara:strand:- start:3582 stop:4517 length:936 start_codon:yes stop_codon:yes gene_type:complete